MFGERQTKTRPPATVLYRDDATNIALGEPVWACTRITQRAKAKIRDARIPYQVQHASVPPSRDDSGFEDRLV